MGELRTDKEYLFKVAVLNAYEDIVRNTMKEISCTERIILEHPDLGTVADGGQALYTNELRRLLSTMLAQYYSVNSFDSLSALSDELNYQIVDLVKKNTTESVAKTWALKHFLREVDRQIKYLKEF